ncbi:MAG: ribbon-helix-helix domain-containing protein [Sulfuricellaceae bacterium]|jgi:hypothetical protein
MSETIRWTIKVSGETDLALRRFLGAQGMKKGDLSRFVEEAVRLRLADLSTGKRNKRSTKTSDDGTQR